MGFFIKRTFTAILVTGFVNLYAQIPVYQWGFNCGSAAGNEYGYDVETDASGNSFVTGAFSNSVSFDPLLIQGNHTSNGGTDIIVAKYDTNGNYIWSFSVGGTAADQGNALFLDAGGNVYVTGFFNSTVDFDPGAGVANLTSAGLQDIFVAKYSPAGTYIWAFRIGNTISDVGRDIHIDAAGNVLLTGYFTNTVDFDPGVGTANLAGGGFPEMFVAKYSSAGTYMFAFRCGITTAAEDCFGITSDPANNIFVTGYFNGTVDFNPGAGTNNLVSAGANDAFVAKYSSAGAYVWAFSLGGTGTDRGFSLNFDAASNIVVSGIFQNTVDFDPGAGVASRTSNGAEDIFVAKYSTLGALVWVNTMGGTGSDYSYYVTTDPATSNVYITGTFQNTVDFDPSAGVVNITSSGFQNIYVGIYLAAGTYSYAFPMAGGGSGIGRAVSVLGSGAFWVTGHFQNTINVHPSMGNIPLNSYGNDDFFLVKYQPFQPLPIELVNFNCSPSENGINLVWSTASESNNKFFTILRSTNGESFESVGLVDGAGNSNHQINYNFTDKPVAQLQYYKLMQTDYDGKSKTSKMIACSSQPLPTPESIQIFDLLGNLVYSGTSFTIKGSSLLAPVNSGLYLVRVLYSHNTPPETKKLMVLSSN